MPEDLRGVKTTAQIALPLPPPPGVPGAGGEGEEAAARYGAIAMLQLTGAVTRMRNASYLFSGPMLEMSGRPGK
jgi:hypothetical protein